MPRTRLVALPCQWLLCMAELTVPLCCCSMVSWPDRVQWGIFFYWTLSSLLPWPNWVLVQKLSFLSNYPGIAGHLDKFYLL